jgi:hypothetical protein
MIAKIIKKDLITMPSNYLRHINKQERLSRSNGLLSGLFYNALLGTDIIELCPEGSSTPFGSHAERGFLISDSRIRREVI